MVADEIGSLTLKLSRKQFVEERRHERLVSFHHLGKRRRPRLAALNEYLG